MRICVFGGSFDPPHVAHQMAALWAVSTGRADLVLWIPCYRHAFGKSLSPFADRFEMCRRAAEFLGARAEVSRVEEGIGGQSRTLVTLQRLREERPGHDWSLLIGADLLEDRTRWAGYEELGRLATFLVVGRAGRAAPAGAPALPDVSSTEVRDRLARGDDVSHLVPAAVLGYARERRLYERSP